MAEAAAKSESSDSMEEILQSIKRIIENDTDDAGRAAGADDVLDLTQVVTDEGKVMPLPTSAKLPPETMPEAIHVKQEPIPSLQKEVEKTVTEEMIQQTAFEEPQMQAPSISAPQNIKAAMSGDGLVSDRAAAAALAALKPISDNTARDYSIPRIDSPALRSGATVEDLLLEALRPMLKSWLDEHLPLIVQKIVEKEVKRIVAFHKD